MKDYYEILGVRREASAQQIRSAYRKLVVQYHPDKNPDPAASQRIREINEAYDVLGDDEKRKAYDMRSSYTWEDVVTTPPAPAHRDPRYRRRSPPPYRPPARSSEYELMKQYLPVMRRFCFAGLLLTTLLALDRVLPSRNIDDEIEQIYAVRGFKSRSYWYDVIETTGGRTLIMYDHGAGRFSHDRHIKIQATRILRITLRVSDAGGTKTEYLGYLYRSLVFFPVILFLTSLLGVLARKDVHFSFSLAIVSAILLILNLYLIFR